MTEVLGLDIGGANQQQTVTLSGATSGFFNLSWQAVGQGSGFGMPGTGGPLQTGIFATAPIPFNATAAQVQAALRSAALATGQLTGTYQRS